MAQTIIGLDIGSFSVKVATVTSSFRSFSWTGFSELPIPHTERDRPERAATEVLREVAKSLAGKSPVVIGALPGERVMTRFVTLPFADKKNVDSVLGFELEGQIPLSVHDMVYTYQVTGQNAGGGAEVFAAAASRDVLEKYLADSKEKGIDPRVVTLDSASYLNLYDHLVGNDGGTVAFVDIGHRSTNLCIVEDGRLRLARAFGRGGLAVTHAIAERRGVDFAEAEAVKHAHGSLPGLLALDTDLAETCADAMRPLAVSLRQSLLAHRKQTGQAVDKILLTGGGSRLEGLCGWLEAELGLHVEPLALERLDFARVPDLAGNAGFAAAKSLAMAMVQVAGTKNVASLDFRRGAFAYAGDFEFVRERLPALLVMGALIVSAAVGAMIVKSRGLDRALREQEDALAAFTKQNLGKEQRSFSKVLATLKKPAVADDEPELFPPMTAIAVLEKVTAIQEKMNQASTLPIVTPSGERGGPEPAEPPSPDGLHPGGPIEHAPPGRDMRPVRDALGIQRDARLGANPVTSRPSHLVQPPVLPAGPGRPPALPRPDPGDSEDDGDGPIVPHDAAMPVPGGPKRKAPETKTVVTAPTTAKIEIYEAEIDLYSEARIRVETHDANVAGKEELRQRIEAVPCFRDVKKRDIGPVVSIDRHKDWVRFEITFRVKCPKKGELEAEKDKKAKKDGADGDSGAAGGGEP